MGTLLFPFYRKVKRVIEIQHTWLYWAELTFKLSPWDSAPICWQMNLAAVLLFLWVLGDHSSSTLPQKVYWPWNSTQNSSVSFILAGMGDRWRSGKLISQPYNLLCRSALALHYFYNTTILDAYFAILILLSSPQKVDLIVKVLSSY